jgi:hypothetical protein
MRMLNVRSAGAALLVVAACVGPAACGSHAGALNDDGHSGQANGSGSSGSNGSSGSGGSSGGTSGGSPTTGGPDAGVNPGTVTATATPYDAKTAFEAARKVKNLLVGLAPTDDDVALVQKSGAAGLQQLIISWTTDMATQPFFRSKMLFFFRNAFQQTGFTPTEDFKPQLLENGGFDFGPFGTAAVGDDAFFRLVQNLQDSFAMTAWQIVQEGQSFLTTLTTTRYMMTTGLKSLYLQIEMPNDQPFAFNLQATQKLQWKVDYSGNAIPLTDTLNPSSPNYMVFDDQAPVNKSGFLGGGGGGGFSTCRGGTTAGADGGLVTIEPFTGYAQLFQRLIGYTPRFPFAATFTCVEHPSKPIMTAQDLSDWEWVSVVAKASGEAYVQPYDLPTLRNTTTLKLALPRIGFFTTPAYLAMWNTNDSNQHRVTANQTLLAALGESFTSDSLIVPVNENGLDSAHTTTGTACNGCHKNLDPMRQFWANQFDFNDRNDFITRSFTGAAPNPRPATTGGTFAFGTVNTTGASIMDFGNLLGQVNDGDPTTPLNQFAAAITQKLCFYANSQACDVTSDEFRRIAFAFQNSGFNFPVLIKELFSSPLITGAGSSGAAPPPISISRRDHFCAALSNRLGVADLCSLAVPLPSTTQAATATIAGGVAADAFSRGSETPVTPSDPNLFFRAAAEELCENLAPLVVDATSGTVYASTNAATAIPDMVQKVMGYPPSDSHYSQAVSILQSHNTAVLAKSNASTALRSTFVLACESPTSVGIGL